MGIRSSKSQMNPTTVVIKRICEQGVVPGLVDLIKKQLQNNNIELRELPSCDTATEIAAPVAVGVLVLFESGTRTDVGKLRSEIETLKNRIGCSKIVVVALRYGDLAVALELPNDISVNCIQAKLPTSDSISTETIQQICSKISSQIS